MTPNEGELWHHPYSRNQYMIHSVTDDGWVRYYSHHDPLHDCYPLWTQPVAQFTEVYVKVSDG